MSHIDDLVHQIVDLKAKHKKHIYEITKILNENPSLLKRGINYQTITKAKAYCKDILRGLKDE